MSRNTYRRFFSRKGVDMWNLNYFLDRIPMKIQVAVVIVLAIVTLIMLIITRKDNKNNDSKNKDI